MDVLGRRNRVSAAHLRWVDTTAHLTRIQISAGDDQTLVTERAWADAENWKVRSQSQIRPRDKAALLI